MKKVDLIINNIGQLVTCRSRGAAKKGAQMLGIGVIADAAVAVKDKIIFAVGKSAEVTEFFEAEKLIDAAGKIVMPAFVECHTHAVFAGNRLDEFERRISGATYMEIMAAGGGIASTVAETRRIGLEDLIEQSRKRLDTLLALGVATCEIKTGYGLNTETELKMLEAVFRLNETHAVDLIPTFLPAHAFPSEYKGRENEYVDLICDEMLEKAVGLFAGQSAAMRNNPFFVDVFCEKNAFSLEQSRRVLETGKRLGMKVKAHVDEFTNLGAAGMAIELGATSIDHLDCISEREIHLLANSDTIGVVTPTVNFNFGSCDFADVRRMIDAGCAIALSTDYNPGSAPCPSPALAMAIACRYQKLLPAEALNAATINAAFAIGSGDKIGSLEVGKQADILILETDDYRQLAYEFGGNFVGTVIKNGEIVVSN